MGRLIKVLTNELIKIEEYKNPRVCFNNAEYDDVENYCVLREILNPFQMFYENKCLQQRIDKAIIKIKKLYEFGNEWHWDNGAIEDEVREIEGILGGKE